MFVDSLATDLDVTGGDVGKQFAPTRLGPPAAQHPFPDLAQFVFGESSLDAEVDMIMRVVRIVDPVLVGKQHLGEQAIAQQQLPRGVVARPASHLHGEDHAHAVFHHLLGQFSVGVSTAGGTAGSALFFLEHENPFRGPSEFFRTLREGALPQAAFAVVAHLPGTALPDVYNRKTVEMSWLNLFVHGSSSFASEFLGRAEQPVSTCSCASSSLAARSTTECRVPSSRLFQMSGGSANKGMSRNEVVNLFMSDLLKHKRPCPGV
jgi:hypothetical protein